MAPKAKIGCERHGPEARRRLVNDRRKDKGVYYACHDCLEENSRRWREKNWAKYLATKANSRNREGSEHMTAEMLQALFEAQGGRCALSGVAFDQSDPWLKASLDRIDSSIGYRTDNIRLVTWIVNHTRGDLTDEQYINMCKAVANGR